MKSKKTMVDINEIHAITRALANMTKDQSDIHAVATQYFDEVLIPKGETPATCLMDIQNQLDEFLEQLIDAVWTRQDFINCDVVPDQLENGKLQ